MRESTSKKLIIYRITLFIIILSSVLSLSSCSSVKDKNSSGPYNTMLDAVNAVLDTEDKDLSFASGLYLYENQESYDNEQPAYGLSFNENELDGNELTTYHYTVRDDIELTTVTTTPPVSEEMLENIGHVSLQEQLKIVEGYKDLTHKVVDLAKEHGRQLDEEIFSAGYSLSGHYEGSVFYIFTIGEQGYLQVAYNTETEEITVAESLDSSIDSDISDWNGN